MIFTCNLVAVVVPGMRYEFHGSGVTCNLWTRTEPYRIHDKIELGITPGENYKASHSTGVNFFGIEALVVLNTLFPTDPYTINLTSAQPLNLVFPCLEQNTLFDVQIKLL